MGSGAPCLGLAARVTPTPLLLLGWGPMGRTPRARTSPHSLPGEHAASAGICVCVNDVGRKFFIPEQKQQTHSCCTGVSIFLNCPHSPAGDCEDGCVPCLELSPWKQLLLARVLSWLHHPLADTHFPETLGSRPQPRSAPADSSCPQACEGGEPSPQPPGSHRRLDSSSNQGAAEPAVMCQQLPVAAPHAAGAASWGPSQWPGPCQPHPRLPAACTATSWSRSKGGTARSGVRDRGAAPGCLMSVSGCLS